MVPHLSESASIDKEGRLQITIGNLSVTEDVPVETEITGFDAKKVSARILTGGMRDMNTFDAPEAVKAEAFEGAVLKDGKLCFTIPACSVMNFVLE